MAAICLVGSTEGLGILPREFPDAPGRRWEILLQGNAADAMTFESGSERERFMCLFRIEL